MKRSLLAASALVVFLAIQAGSSQGRGETEVEALDAKVADDAAAVMTSLWKLRDEECGLGAVPKVAEATMARAAGYYFEYVIALPKSPYAVRDRAGVVSFDLQEETGHIDEVRVTLVTGLYDEKALAARLIEVAGALGVVLEPDEDRKRCWAGYPEGETEGEGWLCFSFGDGVLRIEASQ